MPLAAITPQILFIAGCALLVYILMRRSYRFFGAAKRRSTGPIDVQHRPVTQWDGVQADADARVNRQQVELEEMSRQMRGEIDSKLIALRELSARCDAQIAKLESLLDRAQR
ncbi:hypothetical protein Pla175_50890 [Pirellulimonas nuda]|uniref:Uncharacterized protein n=1 Tax=Pirellulimonas nuda TaxID=2528009 RepID=A0A518DJK4_9BACT|nr:hypothetical protein [Pirellulimonas nuda]QDU91659.1 hypothetical protein Pla175_50890 [Pirellulimonas nuda]